MKTSRTAKAAAITPFVTEVVHTRQTTADGYYEVTIYPILPGILLAFNDVHTTTVPTAASHFFDDCLILNYCLDGRCEFCVSNDNYGYVDSGMSSMAARMAQGDFYYPSGLYVGYEIYIFPPLFTGETEKTLALFGLDLRALRRRCQRSSAYATPRELQLIWEELYRSEGAAPLGTVRLQVLRALHYLDTHALPPRLITLWSARPSAWPSTASPSSTTLSRSMLTPLTASWLPATWSTARISPRAARTLACLLPLTLRLPRLPWPRLAIPTARVSPPCT